MREPLEIRSAESAGSGIMGALRIEAYFPSADRSLHFKWKSAPRGGEGWNNTPRREVAAYLVQKWFLDPEAYVVPTTVARCIPLSDYAAIDPDAGPNLAVGRCVLGTLAVWLDGLQPPEVLLDEGLFYRDARYARSVAEYNLLTYLVANRDTLVGNQLASTDPRAPRVYSVDNGISFRRLEMFHFFQPHWNAIRVPALPREAIGRLRAIGAEDLEALRVVAELRLDARGQLREVPPSPPSGPDGVRIAGDVLQLGLEPGEIADLEQRIQDLIARADRGDIALF